MRAVYEHRAFDAVETDVHVLSAAVEEFASEHLGVAALQFQLDTAGRGRSGRQRGYIVLGLDGEGRYGERFAEEFLRFTSGGRRQQQLPADPAQSEFARQRVAAPESHGGDLVGIGPVVHPSQCDAAAVGSSAPCDGRVVIPAEVHPFHLVRIVLRSEVPPVEITDEILYARAVFDSEAAQHHPAGLSGFAFDREFEQVGALPGSAVCAVLLAETAFEAPRTQIRR